MNIQLDSIYLPSVFSTGDTNILGELRSHFVRNMQIVSHYMRYNELTLAGSLFGINLGLLCVCKRMMSCIGNRFFDGDLIQNKWVRQTSSLLFQALVAGGGIYAINHFMDLQLHPALLAISVISTIAIKIIWQQVIIPEIERLKGEKPPVIKEASKSIAPQEEILQDNKEPEAEAKPVSDHPEEPTKIASEEKRIDVKPLDTEDKTSKHVASKGEEKVESKDNQGEDEIENQVLDDAEDELLTPRTEQKDKASSYDELHETSGGAESMLQSSRLNLFVDQVQPFKK